MQFYTEVAVPLEGRLLSATQFALEMSVEDLRMLDPREADSVRPRYRRKIAPEADKRLDPWRSSGFVDDTGGLTQRAVGARELVDGIVEVTICVYDTPGQYAMFNDGRTLGPEASDPFPYSLLRPQVQWTDRPAADGSVPDGPRWLWVDNGIDLKMTKEAMAQVCEAFKPDPFIQKMPDPTTPTPTR
ncbi:hypothetical protein ACL02S_10315 [Nocardia sp. 004]|uniref:hypothetical protein n=1 Tax=Nocardia sp. 004 TaxID=3385978 RepID=UPI0039A3F563